MEPSETMTMSSALTCIDFSSLEETEREGSRTGEVWIEVTRVGSLGLLGLSCAKEMPQMVVLKRKSTSLDRRNWTMGTMVDSCTLYLPRSRG